MSSTRYYISSLYVRMVLMQNCLKKLKKSRPVKLSLLLAFLAAGLFQSQGMAGGGPENVFLLVNSLSQDSMTIANHYVKMRKIPPSNVHYLEWDKEKWWIHGKTFREEVLLPVLNEIKQRGLAGQIDYLVYSCDFPWQVNFVDEYPDEKFTPAYQPRGSITGTSYLWAFVKDKRKEMFGINTNNYFSVPKTKQGLTVSRGFHTQYRWLPGGQRADLQGIPYMLSMMLGVTYGRGNTAEEIVKYLQAASKVDGTHPTGTVYFMKHKGPRSTPRDQLFPNAARELGSLGVKAEILEGLFPKNKQDILGLTTGTAVFDFPASGCRMLPGSIGDNLTSGGGIFLPGPGQTCLTDFLRHGASGASGTVHEPLSFPQKFPSPFVYVHYAHGCSLAESFYQSIYGPFQQLLVGDPLCQPWANIPEVKVASPLGNRFVSGEIILTPAGSSKNLSPIHFFELFIDGIRRKRIRPGGSFRLDTTKLADGPHEFRVVAIDQTPIETQGRWIGSLMIKNGPDAVQLSIANQAQLAKADYVMLKVVSTQKNSVSIMHNHRELAEIPLGTGSAKIAVNTLGSGPITLQASVAGTTSPKKEGLFSKPISFVLP